LPLTRIGEVKPGRRPRPVRRQAGHGRGEAGRGRRSRAPGRPCWRRRPAARCGRGKHPAARLLASAGVR